MRQILKNKYITVIHTTGETINVASSEIGKNEWV